MGVETTRDGERDEPGVEADVDGRQAVDTGSGPQAVDPGSGPQAMEPGAPPDVPLRAPRPLVERLGMAVIAVVLAAVFAVMAAAAFGGGEPFLGVMAGTGALMTLWVGGLTLRRG